MTIAVPRYVPLRISEVYNITFICTIHPDSTADQCVVMAMANGRVTRTGIANNVYMHSSKHLAKSANYVCIYYTCIHKYVIVRSYNNKIYAFICTYYFTVR